MLKILLMIIAMTCLNGCAKNMNKVKVGDSPFIESTSTKHQLMAIPELKGQPIITIAVYSFPDMTGQRKPSTKFSATEHGGVTGCGHLGDISTEVSGQGLMVQGGREERIRQPGQGKTADQRAPEICMMASRR